MHVDTQLMSSRFKKIVAVCGIFLFVAVGVLPSGASAAGATLSISPASGEFIVGKTVTIIVYLHTGGNLVNAAEGSLNFPPEFLQASSVSKTESLFSIWPVEPTFDNVHGTISFSGGTPTPFSGSLARVFSVIFSIKKAGEGTLSFSGGRILVADGAGTDIFSSSQGASWKFMRAETLPETRRPPSAPTIFSSTHPDSNTWYATNTATLSWPVARDITGVRLLVDKTPDALPTVSYAPPIVEKTVENLEDGVWYSHVRLRNAEGWGEVAHFRIKIDTEPPESFSVTFPEGKETTNPQPVVHFDTVDMMSGIDYYVLKIGDGDFFTVADPVKHNPYKLPIQVPGTRTLLVRAFDKAGNYTDAADWFIVLPPEETSQPPASYGIGTVLILILMLLTALGYIWYRSIVSQKQLPQEEVHKEIHEIEKNIHRAFDLLKEDIEEQLRHSKKIKLRRGLTKAAKEEVLHRLNGNLDDVERLLIERIEGIERDMK